MPEVEKRIPLAFLSITLNVRTERLDFLHRLKTFYAGEPSKAGGANNHNDGREDNIKPQMTEDDLVLLSEGWGDVIIAFQVKSADGPETNFECDRRNRLEQIFKLQNRLFSDFMVERTELILTFSSLTYVVSKNIAPPPAKERNDMWPFSIISRVRITKAYGDGSAMTSANDRFVKRLQDFQNYCSDGRAFDVVRTPGRTDFTIYFRCGHFLRNPDFRRELMTAISAEADDILTVVSYRENLSGNSPPPSFNCTKKDEAKCSACGTSANAGG
ncbi:hypothetical protein [Paramagnetospirillum caucaseum]|uniref:hypothetical protein n=1 Tax=Paramagnetospirillum caucaseum TaxID=1244869 RepID=UPI001269017A|nr:hypothetical protein [Paramagnetospirillum caucaseum]